MFEVLSAKIIYATTAYKPQKNTHYQKCRYDTSPLYERTIAVYKPDKLHKRIDVGVGVDIDKLFEIPEHIKEFL